MEDRVPVDWAARVMAQCDSTMLRKFASYLPFGTQQELKRMKFRREIRRGEFRSPEPEFLRLDDWVSPGDWVIDVGANVGHYTLALSALVGPAGRVFAFEPIPHTFEILAANAALTRYRNVTLMNAAASDAVRMVGMDLPFFDSGLQNFYQASITANAQAPYQVLALSIDNLCLSGPVSLVKIDAEGHELEVIGGLMRLIESKKPVLIVEGTDVSIETLLSGLGYIARALPNSPNRIYTHR